MNEMEDNDKSEETTQAIKSPLRSVRAYCLWCCNDQANEVRLCPSTNCPLHVYRSGHKPKNISKLPSVIKSIRLRCLDCSGYELKRVKNCPFGKALPPERRNKPDSNAENYPCSLYPYRMGKNPNRAGIGGNINTLRRWREEQEMSGSSEDSEGEDEEAMELVTADEVNG